MKRWPYDKFAKHRWWRQLRAHSMMMVRNRLNSLGLFQTRPKKMVDKPYSRTYTQPRAVYCQAFNRHLAPGGAERRRLCSMVVSGGSGAAVTKSLEGKGAQVRGKGMFFFAKTVVERFLGIRFSCGRETLGIRKKKNPQRAVRVGLQRHEWFCGLLWRVALFAVSFCLLQNCWWLMTGSTWMCQWQVVSDPQAFARSWLGEMSWWITGWLLPLLLHM